MKNKPNIKPLSQTFYFFLMLLLSLYPAQSTHANDDLKRLEKEADLDENIKQLEKQIYQSEGDQATKIKYLNELVKRYVEKGDHTNTLGGANKLLLWVGEDSILLRSQLHAVQAEAFYMLNDYESALKESKKGLLLSQEMSDTATLFTHLRKIGITYSRLFKFKEGLEQLKLAELIKPDDPVQLAELYNSIAISFGEMSEYEAIYKDSAFMYMHKSRAEELKKSPIDSNKIALWYNNMAATYNIMRDHRMALIYLDSIKANFDFGKLPLHTQAYIHTNFYWASWELEELFNAEHHISEFIKVKEKILDNRLNVKLKELDYLHKREKQLLEAQQEADIKALRMQRIVLLLVILSLLAIIASILLSLFNNKKKSKAEKDKIKAEKEKILVEQRLLRAQMNPHFIFNSIAVIQSFILQNENKIAAKYLKKFSNLLRLILENSNEKWVSLDSELRAIEDYVDMQLIRFDHSFDYQLELEATLNPFELKIPPMLIQPFVENAIEHGIRNVNNGRISLKIYPKENHLFCEIDDNGVGLNTPATSKLNPEKKSMSTQITKERLSILCKEMGLPITLQIIDKSEQGKQGTFVKMLLPYK